MILSSLTLIEKMRTLCDVSVTGSPEGLHSLSSSLSLWSATIGQRKRT